MCRGRCHDIFIPEIANGMVKVIIPARGGSKGLKSKNIHSLCGKPLLYYSIQAAKEISSDIYVSTDSIDIAEVVYRYGGKVIKRPYEISCDTASTESVLKHAAESLSLSNNELVCYLSPCDPIRKKGDLTRLLSTFQENTFYDSIFFGRESHRHYWHKSSGDIELFANWMRDYKPRQDDNAEKAILECTGYGLLTKACYWQLVRELEAVGYLDIDPRIPEIDIHSALDIQLAKTALEYMKYEVIQ